MPKYLMHNRLLLNESGLFFSSFGDLGKSHNSLCCHCRFYKTRDPYSALCCQGNEGGRPLDSYSQSHITELQVVLQSSAVDFHPFFQRVVVSSVASNREPCREWLQGGALCRALLGWFGRTQALSACCSAVLCSGSLSHAPYLIVTRRLMFSQQKAQLDVKS